MKHTCEKCDTEQMNRLCVAAMVARAERAEALYRDDHSEPGAYWKRQWEIRGKHIMNAYRAANKQQLRADRLESALIKAERRLRELEPRWEPASDESDPEGRS